MWRNVGRISAPGTRLVIRFGGKSDRKADPLSIIEASLKDSGFDLQKTESAGTASNGKRQAIHFSRPGKEAREEYDLWATWHG